MTSKQCQISTEPLFTLHCSWKHIAGFPGPRNQSRGHQSNDFLMWENLMARTSFDLSVFGGSWFIFVTQFRWGEWILPVNLSIFFQRGNLSYFPLVYLFTEPQEKWIQLKQISICSTGTNAFCLELTLNYMRGKHFWQKTPPLRKYPFYVRYITNTYEDAVVQTALVCCFHLFLGWDEAWKNLNCSAFILVVNL